MKQRMQVIGCAMVLALGVPAFGQEAEFQQVFSGKPAPLTRKLKDLNASWFRVSFYALEKARENAPGSLQQFGMLGMMLSGGEGTRSGTGDSFPSGDNKPFASQGEPSYTRGQTLTLGGETFLVTYRFNKPDLDMFMMAAMMSKKNKEAEMKHLLNDIQLTPETDLTLTLVNMKTIQRLGDIGPFDEKKEIEESKKSFSNSLLGYLMKDMVSEKSGEAKADPQVAPSPSASQITPKMREEILARTRASLAAKAGLKSKVFVEFTGEALLLKGTVASPALMEQAEQIARTTLDRYDRSFPMKSQLMVKPTTKHS